ncbi:MAG: hypothetical protein KDD67_06410 [Ignavibacteriae bacterium]|nr:hypothetical protein [Ignavibacteriota bacterium]MCB9215568.1 hypothetical protein [Ignavibacteria bacterium]
MSENIMEMNGESILPKGSNGNREDIAERDRLITKGESVLNLCIQQNKLLCVEGFVDSQIERGGVYLDVVRAMRDYIAVELMKEHDRKERGMLRELHQYVSGKLQQVQELEPVAEL